jgi:hypothetical protein
LSRSNCFCVQDSIYRSELFFNPSLSVSLLDTCKGRTTHDAGGITELHLFRSITYRGAITLIISTVQLRKLPICTVAMTVTTTCKYGGTYYEHDSNSQSWPLSYLHQ